MKNKLKHLLCGFSTLCLAGSLVFASPSGTETVQAASTDGKFHSTDGTVHFLTLPDNTDAILLECDGKFGMVDSGEDNDYPDGSDSRYPARPVIKGNGYEDRVIAYLNKLGVNQDNFEFYIGTHPHSDHIGSADEIIRAFHPKRVYIEPYSDADVTDSTHLWDNLYVYDHMISAAKETGATLIQYFNTDAPLYPETVTVKGSIIWTQPDETEEPEETEEVQEPAPTDPATQDTDTKPKEDNPPDVPAQESDSTDSDVSPDFSNADTSDPDAEPVDPTNTEEPTAQNDNTVLETFSENTTNLSTTDETPNVAISLATVSTAVTPVTEVSTQNTNTPSSTPPETISITLSWGNSSDQSVTLTSGVASKKGSITKVSENQWNYEFQSIPKYDDNKTTYTYIVTPEAAGYSFSKIGDSDYDFSCVSMEESVETSAYMDDSFLTQSLDSGVLDEDADTSLSGTSDNLVTSSIPSSDRVVAGTDSDPTNANQNQSAASGQRSVYENETGHVSAPVFYLGDKNKLKIEIMNYDAPRPQPDANYFSLGVKVTSMQTNATAFLSGDINNYIGTETELAKQLGHVNLLKLGHHGSYGSNTNGYIRSLSPDVTVMTGNYAYVSNDTFGNECGTFDTLLSMGRGDFGHTTPLYVTGWYANQQDALVFHLSKPLSNNITKGNRTVAVGTVAYPYSVAYYENGYLTNCTGWKRDIYGNNYYFNNSYLPLKNQFLLDNSNWYYLNASGIMTTGWILSNGKYYYMNPSDGVMMTGWLQENGTWYYLGEDGAMYTGEATINGSTYYFGSNGAMAVSTWINNKYFGSDGAWIPNYHNANWRKDSAGYWYVRSDGSSPVNQWELIDGKWYYFNSKGYMVTGWLSLGSSWYYLNADGSMHIGWLTLKNTTYYMTSSGAMATGWINLGGTWYYFAGNGAMYGSGWHIINNTYYYMYSNGAMAADTWIGSYYVNASGAWVPGKVKYTAGWIQNGSRWWYRHQDGSYTTNGWEYINGSWYYFDQSGWMVTGWLKLGNTWYYLTSSGAMATGWINLGGTWYYLNGSGAMAANTWIGSCYVNSSGAWVPDHLRVSAGWVQSGSRWWYRHSGGGYTTNGWEYINGSWYYFDQSGWMVTGWLKLGNTWYYLTGSGAMATGWINLGGTWYYLTASGAMAANTWIGSYYVNGSGAWVPGI